MERPPGHAFVSYVHEDTERVDWLCRELESAGIRVWRDIDQLWPGEDWKQKIREAILSGSFAFLGCFSNESESRETSYQREELLLAVEQMRLRRPGRAWLIPVRFDEVDVPDYDLDAGRNLNSLQRVDLLSEASPQLGRLIAAVTSILVTSSQRNDTTESRPSATTVATPTFRAMLRDPHRVLDVEDIVMDTVSEARLQLADESRFPRIAETLNPTEFARLVAAQANQYFDVTAPFLSLLVQGAGPGASDLNAVWSRAIRSLVPSTEWSGSKALINLRQFPAMLAMYAGALSAIDRSNWGALKAVTVDAEIRTEYQERVPLAGRLHPWVVFESQELAANVAAFESEGTELTDEQIEQLRVGTKGKRYTPVDDFLFKRLRPMFAKVVLEDDDFTKLWIRTELMLALIATHLEQTRAEGDPYVVGANFGSWTWRDQHAARTVEESLKAELEKAGASWGRFRQAYSIEVTTKRWPPPSSSSKVRGAPASDGGEGHAPLERRRPVDHPEEGLPLDAPRPATPLRSAGFSVRSLRRV